MSDKEVHFQTFGPPKVDVSVEWLLSDIPCMENTTASNCKSPDAIW